MEDNVFFLKDEPTYRSINVADKESITRYHYWNMLCRTNAMFKYSGDFDKTKSTVRFTETNLQLAGYIGFIKKDDNYYYTWGQLGGIPNYEYVPSEFIVANPYLINKRYKVIYNINDKIDGNIEDYAVVIPNDPLYRGLAPILSYYSQQLAENVISKRLATINLRTFYALTAGTDAERESIKAFYNSLIKGDLAAITSSPILDSIKSLPYADKTAGNTLTSLIEDQQYIKASFFNELGLQANYNMKRESINSNEAQLNQDSLVPLIVEMENCRKYGHELIEQFFGLKINVELDNVWKATVEATLENDDEQSNQLENNEENNEENSEENKEENKDEV